MPKISNEDKWKKNADVAENSSSNKNLAAKAKKNVKHGNKSATLVEAESSEPVTVLRKLVEEAQGPFHGTVTTVKLLLGLPQYYITHPFGTKLFGESIAQLIRCHDPFKMEQTRISLVFEADEVVGNFGTLFGIIKEISGDDIVRCLKESKHSLSCLMPRVSLTLTYLNPPTSR